MNSKKKHVILNLYESFNSRNIDSVLAHFATDVEWPNGWEGGYVHGHAEVRDYWTRQWRELSPIVRPVGFKDLQDKLEVKVHQLVKDLQGNVVHDGIVYHVYSFNDDKIQRMDIRAHE